MCFSGKRRHDASKWLVDIILCHSHISKNATRREFHHCSRRVVARGFDSENEKGLVVVVVDNLRGGLRKSAG